MREWIPVAIPDLSGNEKKYVEDCMNTTWISSAGKYVTKFEEEYAKYMDCKEAISCCNGTVALHIALLALGLQAGDEVIVPSMTYIATANAVKYCGAVPVFADCLTDTWNIDVKDIERKISPKTKGLIAVHLYGNPCDMDAIMNVAKKHNLFVVEDAAECHGALYDGKKVGTIGDIGTFSFFGNKIITTGEGGMIVTNHAALARKMRILKGQGQDLDKRYWFIELGYNYRMTNIEAAIGLAQLEDIDLHIQDRRKVANWYMEQFQDMEDDIQIQKVTDKAQSVWWMFSIVLKKHCKCGRDELMEKLKQNQIETRPLFYPMHVMPVYQNPNANCPNSERIAYNGLNLPTHAGVTKDDVKYIVDVIKKYIR